jgi:hypothetical protein
MVLMLFLVSRASPRSDLLVVSVGIFLWHIGHILGHFRTQYARNIGHLAIWRCKIKPLQDVLPEDSAVGYGAG